MEIGLKERLIGAVVLVVLGIIIIPFFLKGSSPDSGVSQSVTLPPSSATAVSQQYSMALTPSAGTGTSAALAPAASTAAPAVQPAPAKPVVHSIDRQQAPAPTGKWVVQAGSYGSEANANKVVNTLAQHGYHAYVTRFTKGGQTYFRVRVGPYGDRASADKVAPAVARAYGGKADVAPNS